VAVVNGSNPEVLLHKVHGQKFADLGIVVDD
jgi:hypothetical protein